MSKRFGYRGYIGSRPYRNERVAQHVQNLVVRDYCQRNKYSYLLSATEYAMPGCYLMLHDVLREVDSIEGVVLYSIFMLPIKPERRRAICIAFLEAGVTLHGALENLRIGSISEYDAVDELIRLDMLTRSMKIPTDLA